MLLFTTAFFAVSLLISVSCQIPEADTVIEAKQEIEDLITSFTEGRNIPFAAGYVRLAFHDCVGPDGCDGCINHDNNDNRGLRKYTDELDKLYDEKFAGDISRADMYALAAATALEMTSGGTYVALEGFKVGRTSCSTHPSEDRTDEEFPLASFNFPQTSAYFAKFFNMNARETIALMGAHTLGRAHVDNSGFSGPWVRGGESTLDNRYYRGIVNRPWRQREVPSNVSPRKFQWAAGPDILLNCDASLLVRFDETDDTTPVTCNMCPINGPQNRNCCPQIQEVFHTTEFARDNAVWLREFKAVFHKMIDHNGATLQEFTRPTSTTSPPSPPSPQPERSSQAPRTTTSPRPSGGPRPGPGGRGSGGRSGGRGRNGGGSGGRGRGGRGPRKDMIARLNDLLKETQEMVKKVEKEEFQ